MRNFVLSATEVSCRSVTKFFFTVFLTMGLAPAVLAQVGTSTQLSIADPTVAAGFPTLLTASVTDATSHSVHLGTVTFYDGTRSLGSAQIVSGTSGAYPQGTASLKTASFSLGANSIKAVFSGTKNDAASTSTVKTVRVTGPSKTVTALSGGAVGSNFFLNAELESFGPGTPTGSVDFVHESVGSIDTKSLSGATWKSDLIPNPPTAIPGFGYYSLAAGDFNGDGFLDVASTSIISTNTFPNFVNVLLGRGDGSFHPSVPYGVTGNYPAGLYVGDFNNDGRPDLAVFNTTSYSCNPTPCVKSPASIGIMIGNGDGTFKPQIPLAAQPGLNDEDLTGAYIGDFDRDGNLDIAFVGANADGGEIDVILGNGDGSFQAPSSYTLGSSVYAIVGGDLNGDGVTDLVANTNQGQSVLLGKGDGSFLPANTYTLSKNGGIALGDLNGDGKLDLVLQYGAVCCDFPYGTAGTIIAALGKGDGTFATPQTYSIAESLNYEATPLLVDFNQDGKLDIVVGNVDQEGSHVAVFLGNGDGTFQPATSYLQSIALTQEIAGDFNGDGRPDLVGSSFPNATIFTMLNGQTTSFQVARGELGPGTTTVDATYSGDASYSGSTSSPVYLGQGSVDFSGGFPAAGTGLALNNGAAVVGSKLQLTNGGLHEGRSAYSVTPISVSAFQTNFTFQIQNPVGDGFTFTIQNSGPTALGHSGGGLGYQGIPKSVAIKFDINNNANEGYNSVGIYTDGASPTLPATNLANSALNLRSGDPFRAVISYDGTILVLGLTDTVTHETASFNWPIDIVDTVGGDSAYVGFTAATSSVTSTTTISAWKYLAGMPPPTYPGEVGFYQTPSLVFNGSATLDSFFYDILYLNNGNANEAGSVFYATPQNIQTFTTDFQAYQGNSGGGDGLTFTIQSDGPNALGGPGGALGYEGITKSVAIKFDIFNNSGEGNNSTGLYVDGAAPTVPAVDLGGFEQQYLFTGHVTYDGHTLTLNLSNGTFTHSWPIDIPAIVGGPTAYVGFTGGNGDLAGEPSVWYWTYSPGVY